MRQLAFCVFSFFAGAMPALPASATPEAASSSSELVQLQSRNALDLVQQGQCWQRQGPFVTQYTAWQRWQEARGMGYSVSNGVVPCYEGSSRGYCFFVYYAC